MASRLLTFNALPTPYKCYVTQYLSYMHEYHSQHRVSYLLYIATLPLRFSWRSTQVSTLPAKFRDILRSVPGPGTNSYNPGLSRRFRDSWSLCNCIKQWVSTHRGMAGAIKCHLPGAQTSCIHVIYLATRRMILEVSKLSGLVTQVEFYRRLQTAGLANN